MKIEDNLGNCKVKLDDIICGSLFFHADMYFIKTDLCDVHKVNCIDIRTGQTYEFSCDTMVRPILNAKVVIE